MDTPLPPVLFVLGPTGSGKSAFAVALAQRLGRAEIVSADAYQVYDGLPLLTAAPTVEELAAVPHHLIACLHLWDEHDASAHARMALAAIEDIRARGCMAIVTGGSGLYVRFISHGASEAPPSDAAVRARLEQCSTEELVEEFRALDPEGLAVTPIQNKRYLVRNLEMVLLSGRSLLHWRQNWAQKEPLGLGWVLHSDVASLDARIAQRSQEMLDAGLCEEYDAARAMLDAAGRDFSNTARKTLGLSLVEQLRRGELSREEFVRLLALQTRQYAKRQRTWLRREDWLLPLECSALALEANLQSVLSSIRW